MMLVLFIVWGFAWLIEALPWPDLRNCRHSG